MLLHECPRRWRLQADPIKQALLHASEEDVGTPEHGSALRRGVNFMTGSAGVSALFVLRRVFFGSGPVQLVRDALGRRLHRFVSLM
mmetsp:Transcript_2007/g.4810  ORF Transcript_2007/g.4810 Transcript_2007/m.4810 type:complete len:86 (+) Transcript_2007:2683-2940(+)